MQKFITLVALLGCLLASVQAGSYGLPSVPAPQSYAGNVVYETVSPVVGQPQYQAVGPAANGAAQVSGVTIESVANYHDNVVFPAFPEGPLVHANLGVQSYEFGGPAYYVEKSGPLYYSKGLLPIVQTAPIAKVYLPTAAPVPAPAPAPAPAAYAPTGPTYTINAPAY